MATLDFSPEFDGIRDVMDSLTSTSGGSGSVSMSESDTRNRVVRKNGSGMIGNGPSPNYNPGTSTEARQMLDFRNTFRVTTANPTPTWSSTSTKSSVTNYWYGWGTQAGTQIATGNQINYTTGKCWTGSTNHTSSVVPLNPYSGPSVSTTLMAVGKVLSGPSGSFRVVTNADPRATTGSGIMATLGTRSWYSNGTTFVAGQDTVSSNLTLAFEYTFSSGTGFMMQWGGGIYTSFAQGAVPSSNGSAFSFSFLA